MDYDGEGTLHINPDHSGGHSMRRNPENHEDKLDDVPFYTLDSIFERLESDCIGFIKMDIEGGEIAALEGSTNALEHTDQIVVEAYHPIDGESGEPTAPIVRDLLNDAGFNTYVSADLWVYGWRDSDVLHTTADLLNLKGPF